MSKVHAQCYDAITPFGNIKRCIREGHPTMIILRGLPGSGKSTISRELCSLSTDAVVYGADDFFMVNGVYQFDPQKLPDFHVANQKRAKTALENGMQLVIIDNTNMQIAHVRPYIIQAVKRFYEIFFIEPQNEWSWKPAQCAKRNVHNVPKDVIAGMMDRYEKINFSHLLETMGYKLQIQPPLLAEDEVRELTPEQERPQSSGGFFTPPSAMSPVPLQKSVSCSSTQSTVSSSAYGTPFGTGMLPPGIRIPVSSLFSLTPIVKPATVTIERRHFGCQTDDVKGILIAIGDEVDDSSICFPDYARHTVVVPSERNVECKERKTQTETFNFSDLDILVALFPQEQHCEMLHLYTMNGFLPTVQLFCEMGAVMNREAVVEENAFCYDLAVQEASATSENGVRLPTTFDTKQYQSLIDMAARSSISDTTVSDPLSISLDPLQQTIEVAIPQDLAVIMESLFGDISSPLSVPSPTANVPVWLLEQLYRTWKGLPVERNVASDEGFGSGSNSNDNTTTTTTTLDDEEYARRLYEEEMERARPAPSPRKKVPYDVAQKIQLQSIKEEFQSIDSAKVEEIYEDSGRDGKGTRYLCRLFIDPDGAFADDGAYMDKEMGQAEAYQSSRVEVGHRTRGERLHASLPEVKDLASAQVLAYQLRARADEFKTKEKEERDKNEKYRRDPHRRAATAHCALKAKEYKEKADELIGEADRILAEFQKEASILDLHGMSLTGAMTALKEKLKEFDRPPHLRGNNSTRKIRVITGYGKDSGIRVIKPAVKNFFDIYKYKYNCPNAGEFVVTCL